MKFILINTRDEDDQLQPTSAPPHRMWISEAGGPGGAGEEFTLEFGDHFKVYQNASD